jgi:hypothetical protein
MYPKAISLTAGLLVPALGSIVFNLLVHLVEKGALAPIPPSAYDFSFGCAFMIVGIATTIKERDQILVLFVGFAVLLLMLMVVDIIVANLISPDHKTIIVWISNVIALFFAAIAIWTTT